jgi:hypothetical protein
VLDLFSDVFCYTLLVERHDFLADDYLDGSSPLIVLCLSTFPKRKVSAPYLFAE